MAGALPPGEPGGGPLILFRSETLLVRAHVGRGSPLCFVVFDPMTDDTSLDRPAFGEHFFASYGFDAVHVLTAHKVWYQDPDLPEALRRVRDLVRPYARVATYGSSMGGYAALRFSDRVGAHVAIAISPQYSMLPSTVPFEGRWRGLRKTVTWRHERPGDPLPAVAEAVVFFDDRETDGRHAAAIGRDLPGLQGVPISYAGHPAGAVLAEIGLLSSAVLDAAHGTLDTAALTKAIRRERHRSGQYLFTLARRQPLHRLRLKALLAERAVATVPGEPVYRSYAGLVLECLGRADEAVAHHRRATAGPEFGLAVLRLARCLWRVGRGEEAGAAFERAQVLLPRASAENAALIQAVSGRLADAVRLLAEIERYKRRPGLSRALRALSRSRVLGTRTAVALGRRIASRIIATTVLDPRNVIEELARADRD